MPSYVVLLRAVNVGKRQVRMAALREWLEADGFTEVETYIQTGNVRVTTSMRSPAKVEQRLEELLLDKCGFEVPCMVFTPAELSQVYDEALAIEPPDWVTDASRRYVNLYKEPPPKEHADRCNGFEAPSERAWAIGRAVHIWIGGNMMDSKLMTGALARELEPGTNRNINVLRTLVEKWGA
jgi:uncharacterized protein (DUF1697 family)